MSTSDRERDESFLREALDLARPMLGLTTPNPAVGCVIVREGKIVGRGATATGGRPHGETVALA
ncbi:MAG: riboflavin biosynthesis protein RibD, partial [Deltaproteobacteria bacterium]|nr:riboflavin biosynthesis protein RibD [Deltaproteobacteria bacterium]